MTESKNENLAPCLEAFNAFDAKGSCNNASKICQAKNENDPIILFDLIATEKRLHIYSLLEQAREKLKGILREQISHEGGDSCTACHRANHNLIKKEEKKNLSLEQSRKVYRQKHSLTEQSLGKLYKSRNSDLGTL